MHLKTVNTEYNRHNIMTMEEKKKQAADFELRCVRKTKKQKTKNAVLAMRIAEWEV